MRKPGPDLLLTGFVVSILAGGSQAADQAPSQAQPRPEAPPTCEEAMVSPVSGYAECVNPRGAPVDAAPPRPQPTVPAESEEAIVG
jgi:hypothetical protein